MRLLLLIMTGIGFTLGLLCGLLLQLPADGLPASGGGGSNNIIINNNNDHRDQLLQQELQQRSVVFDDRSSYRSRRSFSKNDAAATATTAPPPPSLRQAGLEKSGPPDSPPDSQPGSPDRERGSQAASNPEIGSNPFVAGTGPGRTGDNRRAGEKNGEGEGGGSPHSRDSATGANQGLLGQAAGQAQRRAGDGSGVNGQSGQPERADGSGQSGKTSATTTPPPSPPPLPAAAADARAAAAAVGDNNNNNKNNKPVTSFTLRLKNTGDKFVVDSAVRRQQEEDRHPLDSLPGAGQGGSSSRHVTYSIRDDDADGAKSSSSKRTQDRNNNNNTHTLSDIVSSGVLWSKSLEDSCPASKGLEPREVAAWRKRAAGLQVVRVEEGCGRMQNRLVTFKDGSQACARYRLNTDQIQGEVFSYYLARLLNITNLPPAILVPVNTLSPQWRAVHLEMSMAQWADGRLVVLTRWLDGLSPSYIPHELREETRRLHPTAGILGKKTHDELCDLLQWSDLIVFDYLTANLDRLVNNMFNRQWNAEMMSNPAHNLERTKSGSLVFLDNESGLFHGYRLLDKYHAYHESLLNSLCVFRESTARAVKALHATRRAGEELHKLFVDGEVHHAHLPRIPEKNAGVLKDRLARVYDQIVKCEGMYAPR